MRNELIGHHGSIRPRGLRSTSPPTGLTTATRLLWIIALVLPLGFVPGRLAGAGSAQEDGSPRAGEFAVAARVEAAGAPIRTVPQLDLGTDVGIAAGDRFAVDSRARLVIDLEAWRVVHFWPRGGTVLRYLEVPHLVAIRLEGLGNGILDLRTGRWICSAPGGDILLDGVLSADGETCFLTHVARQIDSSREAPTPSLLVVDVRSGRTRREVALPRCEACERASRFVPLPYFFAESSPRGETLRLEARDGCPNCRLGTPLHIHQLDVVLGQGAPVVEKAWRLVRTLHSFSEDLPDDIWGQARNFRVADPSQKAILGWTPRIRPAANHYPGASGFDYRQLIFAHPRCGLRVSYLDHRIVIASAAGEHLATFVRFANHEWIAFGTDSIWDGSALVSSNVLWIRPDGSLLSSEEVDSLRRPDVLRERLLAAFRCDASG